MCVKCGMYGLSSVVCIICEFAVERDVSCAIMCGAVGVCMCVRVCVCVCVCVCVDQVCPLSPALFAIALVDALTDINTRLQALSPNSRVTWMTFRCSAKETRRRGRHDYSGRAESSWSRNQRA